MTDWSGVAGRRVVLTGGTNGIGLAAAEALAARGARLTLVARSASRASAAAARISQMAPSAPPVDVVLGDLATVAAVRRIGHEIAERYPRIDVLINNAGALFSSRRLTADGLEMTRALNHLAPFTLTTTLLERLIVSAPARIITTSSAAHRGARIPFDDLDAARGYGGFGLTRYGQSKLANILFTVELARRLEGTGVTANCFHPGVVNTGFNRNNGLLLSVAMLAIAPLARSPRRGAETLVWLADAPEVSGISGAYFVDKRPVQPSPAARDAAAARRLWELTEQTVASRGAIGGAV